jgi:hypothetical protein
MPPALGHDPDSLSFFFDPSCPWTWLTSRWFVEATARRGRPVRWRAFSLACITDGDDRDERTRVRLDHAQRALRVVESLTAEERHDAAGDFYTELGTRVHPGGEPLDRAACLAAGEAAGVDDVAARLDDESLDEVVRASFEEIRDVLGDDVGSPAVRLDATGAALFGPLVSPAPTGAEADRLLAATMTLLELPTFYELKRSRTGGPQFG